jgi:hypothetical protein
MGCDERRSMISREDEMVDEVVKVKVVAGG